MFSPRHSDPVVLPLKPGSNSGFNRALAQWRRMENLPVQGEAEMGSVRPENFRPRSMPCSLTDGLALQSDQQQDRDPARGPLSSPVGGSGKPLLTCPRQKGMPCLSADVFPEGFLWGVPTGAFNVEGASIWDVWTECHPGQATPEVASDGDHKSASRMALLRGLQARVDEFSISWSRVFPTGHRRSLNLQGVAYYNQLTDALRNSHAEPMVTLSRWDLPRALGDLGGGRMRARWMPFWATQPFASLLSGTV
ncbi:Lactase-phlorizin hydrolase [Fukomys damarensis]|uniref:Lactase-phlorizin hydrolase n=1 Tax=Fukomys damarensis TaxID=885580 RepID=A0A091CTI1_FUKDA|nr:Lactase-phlorizin hydrolase [Fukomys damarensis]